MGRFAAGAERAKKTGFDGIEIHSSHSYLLAQFLSPSSNKRQDIYGGSLENRARFLVEVIHAIREAVGRDYPVWCRINGMEFIKERLTLDEAKKIARIAHDTGVDAVHVSAWPISSYRLPSMDEPAGNLVHLAEAVKKVVSVPVIAVGRITPEMAVEVLRNRKADLVAMGKALIADPDLPSKLASGRRDDIVPCIGCIYCHPTLRNFGTEDGWVRCCINTMTSREGEYAVKPAWKAKKVMIVGAGPGGMEAARIAKLRGHDVILYDKKTKLGGQLQLARIPPHKAGIDTMIAYFTAQITNLAIHVNLGQTVTPDVVRKVSPDAVVLAAGATLLVPEIPGIEGANIISAEEALTNRVEVGHTVVVIGGGLVGCETAEYLVEKGKNVTIIEMLKEISIGVWPLIRIDLPQRLAARGVKIMTGVTCERLAEQGLEVVTEKGKRLVLQADTVVLAAGARPNQELPPLISGIVPEVHLVGDCKKPRRILVPSNI